MEIWYIPVDGHSSFTEDRSREVFTSANALFDRAQLIFYAHFSGKGINFVLQLIQGAAVQKYFFGD
jgi:hypothetical protein